MVQMLQAICLIRHINLLTDFDYPGHNDLEVFVVSVSSLMYCIIQRNENGRENSENIFQITYFNNN